MNGDANTNASPLDSSAGSKLAKVHSHSSVNLAAADEPRSQGDKPSKKSIRYPRSLDPQDWIRNSRWNLRSAQGRVLVFVLSFCSRPNSPACVTPSKLANPSGDKEWETGSSETSPAPEYTGGFLLSLLRRGGRTVHEGQPGCLCPGPRLFKEPSFKSNKFIIHNALSRCCLAGKVNEAQKNKIVEVFGCSQLLQLIICILLSCSFFTKRRRWRRATPTTSSSCSGIPVASSGAFTPPTPTPRSWYGWLAWARGQLAPPRWSPCSSTAQTESSSAASPPKPWA